MVIAGPALIVWDKNEIISKIFQVKKKITKLSLKLFKSSGGDYMPRREKTELQPRKQAGSVQRCRALPSAQDLGMETPPHPGVTFSPAVGPVRGHNDFKTGQFAASLGCQARHPQLQLLSPPSMMSGSAEPSSSMAHRPKGAPLGVRQETGGRF